MILVTGATGNVGNHVVTQLHEAGNRVRALTRTPDKANLPDGVDVVRGDLSDASSLDAALQGVDSVFLVWPTLQADEAASEVVARIAERVSRIVYLSSMGAGESTDPVTSSHAMMERLVEDAGVEWTFLRPGGFATNDLQWSDDIHGEGVVREPFSWSRAVIHEVDIAAAGVRALTESGHSGARYELTGPRALSQQERLETISEVIGRESRFETVPREAAREQMLTWLPPEAVDGVLDTLEEVSVAPVLVTDTFEKITGRPPQPYRQWVLDHIDDFGPR